MLENLFLNPGYLAVAAGLISVPIIIHLINRMRFKRMKWAAMEFLLKAQKRAQRRLIIEQLLLLMLRCFLVMLAGILMLRMLNVSPMDLANLMMAHLFGSEAVAVDNRSDLYVVVLDDSLSMKDQWKDSDGRAHDAFQVAKQEILTEKIVKRLQTMSGVHRLMLLPLSKLATAPDWQPKIYDRLNDPNKAEELRHDIEALDATYMHGSLLPAMKRMRDILTDNATSKVYVRIVTDFRQKDWGLPRNEGLYKEILDLCKGHKNLRVKLIDTAHPFREERQGNFPLAHDNVGITELSASTRIAGANMPVSFTAVVANYSGREVEFKLKVTDENTGRIMHEVDFSPSMPMKLRPEETRAVNFVLRFRPALKPGETHFEHLSVQLQSPALTELPNDGLLADNIRHIAVEVRNKVPILVIDGDGPKGREDDRSSYFVYKSLISVPGGSLQPVFGDELAGDAVKALERPDLNQYPIIFLLNVRELKPKQLANLETFVRDGGGVVFFMGPNVSARYYNTALYKEGDGLFPAPLRDTYFPPEAEPALPPKAADTPQLLIRDANFSDPSKVPIFGAMFSRPEDRDPLRDLPIYRYFKVARTQWKSDPGRVFELATMPNDQPVTEFQAAVIDLVAGDLARAVFANKELGKYHGALQRHFRDIQTLVAPGSERKAYHLAEAITRLLNDRGSEKDPAGAPNLTEFWADTDAKVMALQKGFQALREQVFYGDPMVVAKTHGKGKAVAVMTTAGKEWNGWGGGTAGAILYEIFMWEMLNYLSSQDAESNLTVGTPLVTSVDAEPYKQQAEALRLTRTYMSPQAEAPAKAVKLSEEFGKEEDGVIPFRFTQGLTPGLYLSNLKLGEKNVGTFAHVFNVDTAREGALARVGMDQLDKDLIRAAPDQISFMTPNSTDAEAVSSNTDLSESPWFFLLFLCILVAEQALAVHLSFHLRSDAPLPLKPMAS